MIHIRLKDADPATWALLEGLTKQCHCRAHANGLGIKGAADCPSGMLNWSIEACKRCLACPSGRAAAIIELDEWDSRLPTWVEEELRRRAT